VGLFVATPELEADTPAGAAARAAASAHLNAHVRLEFNIPGITFGGRYDGSPLIINDGSKPPPDQPNAYVPSACPGGRPPHAWVADGRALFDSFNFEWTLLALGPDAPDASAFVAAARQAGLDLQVAAHAAPELASLYEAPLVLVRPDQIVAWRGHDDSRAAEVLALASGRR
jgi:hypothetical protein